MNNLPPELLLWWSYFVTPLQQASWLDIIGKLGPLIAVFGALYVGYLQRKIMKRQLEQNLFDKRWQVFSGVQKYLIVLTGQAIYDPYLSYKEFHDKTDNSLFLFGNDVHEFIDSIGTDGLTLKKLRTDIKLVMNLPERHTDLKALRGRERRIKESLKTRLHDEMFGVFQKYLSIGTSTTTAETIRELAEDGSGRLKLGARILQRGCVRLYRRVFNRHVEPITPSIP